MAHKMAQLIEDILTWRSLSCSVCRSHISIDMNWSTKLPCIVSRDSQLHLAPVEYRSNLSHKILMAILRWRLISSFLCRAIFDLAIGLSHSGQGTVEWLLSIKIPKERNDIHFFRRFLRWLHLLDVYNIEYVRRPSLTLDIMNFFVSSHIWSCDWLITQWTRSCWIIVEQKPRKRNDIHFFRRLLGWVVLGLHLLIFVNQFGTTLAQKATLANISSFDMRFHVVGPLETGPARAFERFHEVAGHFSHRTLCVR